MKYLFLGLNQVTYCLYSFCTWKEGKHFHYLFSIVMRNSNLQKIVTNNATTYEVFSIKRTGKGNIIDFRTYGVIHFLFANYLQSRFSFQLGLGWRGCPFILLGKGVGKMGTFKNDKLKHTVWNCLESDERKNSH